MGFNIVLVEPEIPTNTGNIGGHSIRRGNSPVRCTLDVLDLVI